MKRTFSGLQQCRRNDKYAIHTIVWIRYVIQSEDGPLIKKTEDINASFLAKRE